LTVRTREIAVASVLGALSVLCEIVPGPPFDIPFPLYPQVTWDITGIPMMISLLLFGPFSAIYTCLVGCAIIFLRGNISGGVFKVIAELSTVLAYALIRQGRIVKTLGASFSRVIVMTITNYYLLQVFYNLPEGVVVGLLPVLAVFNFSQALINVIPAQIIHKRIKQLI
jgi:riboflavin transporter FmnP